jgi:hypothetical protein
MTRAKGGLSVEAGEQRTATCDHCGQPHTVIHGFVYAAGEPFAVYQAGLYSRHPDDRASLAISLGDWSESATGAERQRMAIQARPTPNRVEMHIDNRSETPWDDSEVLGRLLDRDEALAHPLREDYLEVAEFVILQDERLSAALGRVAERLREGGG